MAEIPVMKVGREIRSWALSLKWVRDYVVMTKPRINILVLITVLTGMVLTPRPLSSPGIMLAAVIGTGLCVAGANVLNGYMERGRDALMDRTRDRPLPAGRVRPLRAFGFGLLCSTVGLGVLVGFVNGLTAGLALLAIVSYAPLYTWLKPLTSLSTLVGAVPGALPPVIGWAAIRGQVELPAVVLFLIIFLWQPPHFLALAHFYRDDYEQAGHAMLPVEIGDRASLRQICIYTTVLIPVSLYPAMIGMGGWPYVSVAVLLGIGFLIVGGLGFLPRVHRSPEWARGLFLYSILYLPLLFAALVLDGSTLS